MATLYGLRYVRAAIVAVLIFLFACAEEAGAPNANGTAEAGMRASTWDAATGVTNTPGSETNTPGSDAMIAVGPALTDGAGPWQADDAASPASSPDAGGAPTAPRTDSGAGIVDAGRTGDAGDAAADAMSGDGDAACPSSPCKILPLGDSITFGVGDEPNGGYRGPLFASAVSAAKKLTFTGSLSNGPASVAGQTFPKKNEGHNGWGITEVTPYSGGNAGIATLIPNPAFSSASGGVPDVILLHIGTNDASQLSAARMTTDLGMLLDKILASAPQAYVVVAQIVPLGYGNNEVIQAYNRAIPGLVQQRASAGKRIALVDMFTGFNPATMLGADKVHPNSAGYKFMAERWYSVIGPLLPQ